MMSARYILVTTALMGLLLANAQSSAQDDYAVSVSQRVDFTLVYSSLQLAFETWDETGPPDSVFLSAHRVASGFLAGVPFRYERNRDRMTITEQVEEIGDDMEYMGFRDDGEGTYYFDYTVLVPVSRYTTARTGQSSQGHGVSELEEIASARREARREAFEDAVRAALRANYTDRNEQIPGLVSGRIEWYEIDLDIVDPESGSYVFDLSAWVSFSEE